MSEIRNISLHECTNSNFVTLKRMKYTQKGVDKAWDLAEVHDSVAILIYHKEKNSFIIVKQFRPPVYLKNSDGYTYELCAGIIDKKLSLKEIAKEEILEECGYDVEVKTIEKISSFFSSVGFAGSVQTLYYAEVNESMKVSEGGGIEVEDIEVVYLHVDEARSFIFDESKAKTPGIMFAFMYFFEKISNDTKD